MLMVPVPDSWSEPVAPPMMPAAWLVIVPAPVI